VIDAHEVRSRQPAAEKRPSDAFEICEDCGAVLSDDRLMSSERSAGCGDTFTRHTVGATGEINAAKRLRAAVWATWQEPGTEAAWKKLLVALPVEGMRSYVAQHGGVALCAGADAVLEKLATQQPGASTVDGCSRCWGRSIVPHAVAVFSDGRALDCKEAAAMGLSASSTSPES